MKTLRQISCLLVISLLGISTIYAQKKPIETVKDYFKYLDQGDAKMASMKFSNSFKFIASIAPDPLDIDGWKMVAGSLKQAFPDMQHRVDKIFTDGMTVGVKGTFIGTNSGTMMGNPATGNKVMVPFNTIFEFEKSGKLVELTSRFDNQSFNDQLMGVNPMVRMNAEKTVRELMKAVDAADESKIKSLLEPDAVHYFQGQKVQGDGLVKRTQAFKMGFPDIERKIEDVVVANDVVTLRGRVTGTHTGVFMGMKPSGNSVDVPFLATYKLSPAGKMKEGRIEFDTRIVMQQLSGILATPDEIRKNVMIAYESLNKRDWVKFRSVCNAQEFTEYSAGPTPIIGIENAISAYQSYFNMFPDMKFEIKSITIDGNKVILENSAMGTNTGNVMGMLPPTGKSVRTQDVDIIIIDKYGKAISHSTANPNEVFHQIGYGSLSNPNTGTVMDIYKNFGMQNPDGVLAHVNDKIYWDNTNNPVVKSIKPFMSKSEIKSFFTDLMKVSDVTRFDPINITADGDHVITIVEVEWKLKSNGKKWKSTFNHHFKFENGKLVWFQEVTSIPREIKGV